MGAPRRGDYGTVDHDEDVFTDPAGFDTWRAETDVYDDSRHQSPMSREITKHPRQDSNLRNTN